MSEDTHHTFRMIDRDGHVLKVGDRVVIIEHSFRDNQPAAVIAAPRDDAMLALQRGRDGAFVQLDGPKQWQTFAHASDLRAILPPREADAEQRDNGTEHALVALYRSLLKGAAEMLERLSSYSDDSPRGVMISYFAHLGDDAYQRDKMISASATCNAAGVYANTIRTILNTCADIDGGDVA